MSGISDALKNAAESQDADTAQVFANILNTDLLAMKSYKGVLRYEAHDALRLSRILQEYQQMNRSEMLGKMPSTAKFVAQKADDAKTTDN